MIGWIIFAIFLEYYSVGVTVLAKRNGMKNYGLCMIPFYSMFYMNKALGSFTVWSIKVEKWGRLAIELTLVCLGAYLYSQWGANHLTPQNAQPLAQIMRVPICACIFIGYLSFVNSTAKALFLMGAEFKCQWLVCALLLPIPFLLAFAGQKRFLAERRQK